MAKVVDYPVKFGGKIYINDPIQYEVINKLPVGVIKVSFNIGCDFGETQDNPNQPRYPVGYRIEDTSCILQYGNIHLSNSLDSPEPVDLYSFASISYIFKISTEELNEVESRRTDDIILYLKWRGKYIPHKVNDGINLESPQILSFSIPWKFSQKEWLKFLSDIGYSEKWIVEIDRPKLEGFHEVIEFIQKAQEALFNRSDPEDVLRDLRAARDSFRDYYESKKKEIAEIIDKGSIGESGQPPKSERIIKIYDSISSFLNIGPHNDKYKVTYQDAQLAFREFVSMLSYLSPTVSELTKEEKKKGE